MKAKTKTELRAWLESLASEADSQSRLYGIPPI